LTPVAQVLPFVIFKNDRKSIIILFNLDIFENGFYRRQICWWMQQIRPFHKLQRRPVQCRTNNKTAPLSDQPGPSFFKSI
jgi:hypothetical protein